MWATVELRLSFMIFLNEDDRTRFYATALTSLWVQIGPMEGYDLEQETVPLKASPREKSVERYQLLTIPNLG